MKNETILCTGAGGFLGSSIARRFRKEDIVLTSLHAQQDRQIIGLDLSDGLRVIEAFSQWKPSVVFHLGAVVNLSRDYLTAKATLETNILSTLNILEACKRNPPDLFVFASTEEVYGDSPLPYREDMTPRPPSPYAVSKVACEQLVRMYSREAGFSSVIFRIGTMYGPYQPETRFIPSIIRSAIAGKDIKINSGKKSRDYVYIDDIVEAFVLTRQQKLSHNTTVINLGGGVTVRLIDLVARIIQETGSSSQIITGSIPERTDEAEQWLMENSKAKQLLGWEPRTSLTDGVRSACEYYRKQA